MSRGVAGLIGDTLVVTLPGSSAGAREAVEAIFPAILHVIRTRRKSREHLTDESE
jgi:molybdopterin biosynthesis enzyme MoaB